MIKLRRQEQKPAQPETQSLKAFEKNETWEQITSDEFLSMTIKDLCYGPKRILIVGSVEGCGFILVTNQEDREMAKRKYPGTPVITPKQVINWFTSDAGEDDIEGILKSFMIMSVFEGATIVKEKRYGKNQELFA